VSAPGQKLAHEFQKQQRAERSNPSHRGTEYIASLRS
jgi:hypothetical protein